MVMAQHHLDFPGSIALHPPLLIVVIKNYAVLFA